MFSSWTSQESEFLSLSISMYCFGVLKLCENEYILYITYPYLIDWLVDFIQELEMEPVGCFQDKKQSKTEIQPLHFWK